MMPLTYVGKAPDVRTWKGPVTGTIYKFGPGTTRMVDTRDAAIWLNPRGDGSRVFEKGGKSMAKPKAVPGNTLAYTGARKGWFVVVGGVTGKPYLVEDGQVTVNPADVKWFLRVNGGKDYKIAPPKPKPKPEPVPEPEPIQGPDTGLAELDAEIAELGG